MPDIKEVYEMVTKQTGPKRGALERQFKRQDRRNRNRRIGAFAVAAAIAAGAALLILVNRPTGDTTQPAETGTVAPVVITTHEFLDIATGERSPVPVDLTGARLPEVSPNGEAIAYFTFDQNGVFVAQLDGSSSVTIKPDDLDGSAPTWIDNETILFQGRAKGTNQVGDLYTANVSTGDVTMVTDLPDVVEGNWFVISDVSPDGSTVLYDLPRGKGSDATSDLWTAPLAGGEPTLLRRNAGFGEYGPDGSIVFVDHPADFARAGIWTMDGAGTNARQLVTTGNGSIVGWLSVSPDGTSLLYNHIDDNDVEFTKMLDIETGRKTTVGSYNAEEPTWYDNDTLIVP